MRKALILVAVFLLAIFLTNSVSSSISGQTVRNLTFSDPLNSIRPDLAGIEKLTNKKDVEDVLASLGDQCAGNIEENTPGTCSIFNPRFEKAFDRYIQLGADKSDLETISCSFQRQDFAVAAYYENGKSLVSYQYVLNDFDRHEAECRPYSVAIEAQLAICIGETLDPAATNEKITALLPACNPSSNIQLESALKKVRLTDGDRKARTYRKWVDSAYLGISQWLASTSASRTEELAVYLVGKGLTKYVPSR